MSNFATPAPRMAMPGLQAILDRTTYNGWVLFLIGLSLMGSGFEKFRYKIAGLLVHPYLFIVALIFPILAAGRLRLIPTRITMLLFAFAAIYFVASFQGGVQIGDSMKLMASVVTILTVAMLVRTWGDISACVVGMAIAVALLAGICLVDENALETGELEAIEGGNKNAYSVYALPPILLGSYLLLRQTKESFLAKATMAVSLLFSSLCICLNTNRSGWIGLFLIIALLAYEKSIKAAIVFALLGGVVYGVLTTFYSTAHLQNRVNQSRTGTRSDDIRKELIWQSVLIGFENPLLGASPKELHYELAKRLHYEGRHIDTHNLYAHLIGGCGLVCFFIFLSFGRTLWAWPAPPFLSYRSRFNFLEARKLLRYTIILFAVRGMFTAEILFAPAFCIAIGLGIGWAVANSSADPTMIRLSRSPELQRRRPA